MHVGDREGLDQVYDSEGELLLRDQETILVREDDLVPTVKSTWGYFGGEEAMEASRGTIFLTNMRLVFIAQPHGIKKITSTDHGIGQDVVNISDVSGLKGIDSRRVGVKDYFEIPIKEVMGCEVKSEFVSTGEHVNVYILSKGEQYHMNFVAPKNSALLLRLKRKQVENVSELIKNIKYYADNVSWVMQPEDDVVESTEYRAIE